MAAWDPGLIRRCGDAYQLCGTRHYRLTDGRADGCRCIDVRTGSGLDFTVVCDRAMDISLASYRGVNLVFLAPDAEAHPAYYESFGNEWLRTFSAGLLTTLGPTHLGPACTDGGEALGLHGRLGAVPARRVADLSDAERGTIELRGTLTDAAVLCHKLRIRRTIRASAEHPSLLLTDEVENFGAQDVPLCMLYHINFGYPLLSPEAELLVPDTRRTPLDAAAGRGSPTHIAPPDVQNVERNYDYTFPPGAERAVVGIWNGALCGGLGVYIRFDPRQLPHLNEWVLEAPGDYVAALEPSTCLCKSRSELRRLGALPVLPAGARRTLQVEIGVLRGEAERRALFGN